MRHVLAYFSSTFLEHTVRRLDWIRDPWREAKIDPDKFESPVIGNLPLLL